MAEGHNFWKNKLQDRNQLTEKLSNRKPNTRTQMTRRLKWQEDPSDKKTQRTGRLKWKKDPNYRKIQMTRRHMWQEEWVAERLTDRMLTDGHPPICWMPILKKILKLYSLSNWEDDNTSTTSWSVCQ